MLKWLSNLFWQHRINSIRDELREQLSDRISQIEVGSLTLECLSPAEPQTSTVIARAADGTEKHHKVTVSHTHWDGETQFPFWDKRSLQISLIADGDEPSSLQVRQINSLVNHEVSIRQSVLSALLDYYRNQVLPHNPTNEDGDPLPAITNVSQLDKVFVSDEPSIHLSDTDATDAVAFSLGFGAWWGYHDVQVHVRDWQVQSVG